MTRQEFERWFRLLYLPLGMYALRLTEETDSAEDVVQEAFINAWQEVCDGAVIENFKAYMYRCVRNGCLTLLRSRRQTVGIEEIPESGEEEIDTSVRDARIWRAIGDLPERCREVFLLSKRDGLSNEEIAEELGISIKTVKNQMTKAFDRLRDALSDGGRPFFLPFL